jgi:hypothetical protein
VFRAQLQSLNESQLSLERLKRELNTRQRELFSNWELMRDRVAAAETYLGCVLSEWEEKAPSLDVGVPASAIASLKRLHEFLDDTDVFKSRLSAPLEKVQEAMSTQL